jgi:hypothetical protein
MATHDYVIANGTGAAVRSDLNNALAAIVSNNSGSSEPGTTYAYQWWADTNANVLKIRNSSNDGWITLRELDGTMLIEDGSASTPGLAFADDVNTGIFSPAADQIGFATGGAERLEIGSSEVVFNDPSNDVDFRVESNGQTHMLFVDAGNDRIGIGTGSPSHNLDILSTSSGATVSARVGSTATSGVNSANLIINNGGTGNGTLRFDYESDTNRASIGISQSTQDLEFGTAGSERARIDSSGRLLINHSSSRSVGSARIVQIEGTSNTTAGVSLLRNSNDANSPTINLGKSRGTSTGSNTVVQSGDGLGSIYFRAADGTDINSIAAAIDVGVDGTPGSNDTPGRIMLGTTADGASSPTERIRLDSSGRLLVGTTTSTYNATNQTRLGVVITGDTSRGGIDITGYTGGSSTGRAPEVSFNRSIGTTDGSVTALTAAPWTLGQINFSGSTGSNFSTGAQIRAVSASQAYTGSQSGGELRFFTVANSSTSLSERLRIEDEGRSMFFAEEAVTYMQSAAGAGTTHALITGVHSNSTVSLRVWTNGNIQNTNNSYGSLSDSKLKENIVDANSQWDDIKDIRVRNYNFIEGETHTQLGVVAQEVETVSPGLVYETPDVDDDGNDLGTVTKSVNYSVLYMKAVKALQEAMDRIETLETKVAALEAG